MSCSEKIFNHLSSSKFKKEDLQILASKYAQIPPSASKRELAQFLSQVWGDSETEDSETQTQKVEIYVKSTCPYSIKALELLDDKGVQYTKYVVDGNAELIEETKRRSGRATVPQIFINGQHIGGFSDLKELEEKGELDSLLNF